MAKTQVDPVEIGDTGGEVTAVDLSQVEEQTFEVLPKGKFPAVITECDFDYSQNSGNPMWTLRMEVEGGDHDGHVLMMWLVWAGKGVAITKSTLRNIAPELLEGPVQPDSQEVLDSMVGRRVIAEVVIRKYEGEPRNSVRRLLMNTAEAEDAFA